MTGRLLIEYDGSNFAGWATQPGQRTVQPVLEHALSVVLRRPHGVRLIVAGRTDAGVHAWGQVASYDGEAAPVSALNAVLPDDVAVLECEPAPDGFDARHDATSRAYCYRVLARPGRPAVERGRVLHCDQPVDRDALDACAAQLVGVRNFVAFTPTETYHTRFHRDVYTARWQPAAGEILEFWIEADTFMRHMNRALVGTMLEVATGRRTLESFAELLTGRPRAEAGRTAPARGLYLAGVGYDDQRLLSR